MNEDMDAEGEATNEMVVLAILTRIALVGRM